MEILVEQMRVLMDMMVNFNDVYDDSELFEGINKIIWQRCIFSAKVAFCSTRRAPDIVYIKAGRARHGFIAQRAPLICRSVQLVSAFFALIFYLIRSTYQT